MTARSTSRPPSSRARRTRLGVRQPPFSAVFAIDTSGSIDPFLHLVTQGLRSFLADVLPGREVVSIIPFDEQPLLRDWEDDPYLLQAAFDDHVVEGNGSSSVETGLVDASDALQEREGARAILLVTDAETSSYEATPDMWDRLAAVRPIIFAVHIGGVEQPVGHASADAGLGGDRRRCLRLPVDRRGDGPRVRADGDLAPEAGRLHAELHDLRRRARPWPAVRAGAGGWQPAGDGPRRGSRAHPRHERQHARARRGPDPDRRREGGAPGGRSRRTR